MKKIFIMFLLSFSFAFASKFENFNLDLLKKEMLMNAYDYKEEGDYLFFKKRDGKYEERITVFLFDKKVYSLLITSNHFFSQPNKKKMNQNLIELFDLTKKSINDPKLTNKVSNILKKLNDSKPGELIEFNNYYIRTSNLDVEQSVKISLD
ncbi:MAG: hypothetical protein ACRCZH_03430 [Cetobacterium sp.]